MPKAKKNKKTGKMVSQHSAARKRAIRASDRKLSKASRKYAQAQKNISAGSKKKVSIWKILFGK